MHVNNIQGLTTEQVSILKQQYGKNIFRTKSSSSFIRIFWDLIKEPMFILLAIACSLYFILGEKGEGMMMLAAMFLVATISVYQQIKSSNALKALQQFIEPEVPVIRNGKEIIIPAKELVPNDIILLHEGMSIPADANLLQENDFTVNESIITGESLPVEKNEKDNILYQGSTINSGKCIAQVMATGSNTVLGKLGKSIETYHSSKTLLQLQIGLFVRRLALFGLAGFFIIFLMNYLHYHQWITSLLFSLTLAMSVIPEEIPVAFSSFMALGAYKMSKLGIISRQPQIVENLGAVSVLCFDKTGTITENKMEVKTIYDYESDRLIDLNRTIQLQNENILLYGVLACEINPFDTMEKAIWEAHNLYTHEKAYEKFKMIFEYPLEGRPPMMTHVYEYNSIKIAAAKGAAERIIRICNLNDNDKNKVLQYTKSLASKGYRVIGVASSIDIQYPFPDVQENFNWHFEGLLALHDPPKKNIREVFRKFYNAKIDVKIITGDYPETAVNIAGQIGMINHASYVTGEQIMKMTNNELKQTVKNTKIFARMFPNAKLKVIECLKANGEIVAMTGDGVNDGPALKSANIGIAMGKKGTEIARQAADLILTDDNLERIVTAIKEGRKIFNNLKKALRYIISIHIPIIMIAAIPVIFGWIYPNIFTPIHIIFLELIMGPTCSIFFERESIEENVMQQQPRKTEEKLFTIQELFISILQGIVIASGILVLYYYFMNKGTTLEQTRSIVFTTLILSNILLTFVNRSFIRTIYYTSRYKNNLALPILIISFFFLAVLHFSPFIRKIFQLEIISFSQFCICLGVAFVSVIWVDVYKIYLNKVK